MYPLASLGNVLSFSDAQRVIKLRNPIILSMYFYLSEISDDNMVSKPSLYFIIGEIVCKKFYMVCVAACILQCFACHHIIFWPELTQFD